MRISDWSSDVCSSDLAAGQPLGPLRRACEARSAVSRRRRAARLPDLAPHRPPGIQLHPVEGERRDGRRTAAHGAAALSRSEEHTSELQSLMRISYAVFCLKKKKQQINTNKH